MNEIIKSMLYELNTIAEKGGGKVIIKDDYYIVMYNNKMIYKGKMAEDIACWLDIRIKFGIPLDAKRNKTKRR